MQISLKNLKDSHKLATKLSSLLQKSDIILLKGTLGSGKTTFAQFLINEILGEKTEVLSPTFSLVQPYEAADFTIWHFDLYRLKATSEAFELGIEEAFDDGVSIIEWPEIIGSILPEDKLLIELSFEENDTRLATLKGYGKWAERIKELI